MRIQSWVARCRSTLRRAGAHDLSACDRATAHADAEHVRDLQLFLDGAAAIARGPVRARLQVLSDEALDIQEEFVRRSA